MKCVLTILPGYNTGEECPSTPQSSNMHNVNFCVFQYKGMAIMN